MAIESEVETSEPVICKRPSTDANRIRKRRQVTVPDEVWAYLEKMVEDEDAVSVSQAIDVLVQVRQRAAAGVIATLGDSRTKFLKHCAKYKADPSKLAGEIIKKSIAD